MDLSCKTHTSNTEERIIVMNTNINLRPGKGKSIIDFPEEYIVIDIETTGLSPKWDNIIEISGIHFKNDIKIDSFSELVYCAYINSYVQDLTGITADMLASKRNIEEVMVDFCSFVGDKTLVGHNVNFDINFLYDNAINTGLTFSNNFIDTMRMSRKLFPELAHHRLEDMAEHYGFERPIIHRGDTDCETTYRLYSYLKIDALKKFENIDSFQKSFVKKHKPEYQLKAKNIFTKNTEFDESHPIFGKTCVFTGTLEKMIRREAMQHVVDLGGLVADSITTKTNFLIMGNLDYCKSIKDGKSTKQKKAEKLKIEGQDINIIDEYTFYDLIEEN